MKKPIKKTLQNGLRLIFVPMPGSPTVTTIVFANAGSKDEEKINNGISHFLEHMFFKGTEKRKNPVDISGELDGLGSMSNAFTWHEYTAYYAKSQKKNFKKITDVVSDMYLHSVFPVDEIEKERGVILAEIDMYNDLPKMDVHELLDKLMYGDQPAGWSILGPKENIKRITQEDFIAYRNAHYVSEKTVVVVAGDLDKKTVFDELEEKFKNISTAKGKKRKKTVVSQKKKQSLVKYKKTDQTHFAIGMHSFKKGHAMNTPLRVLGAILGGGMSSRLFQRLRGDLGAAYYLGASNTAFSDTGMFTIYAGIHKELFNEVLRAISKELVDLKNNRVLDKELRRAKDYIIGNMHMGLESTNAVAIAIGSDEIQNQELKTPTQIAKEINAITPADIQKAARKIFNNNNTSLAVVGPYKDSKSFLKDISV